MSDLNASSYNNFGIIYGSDIQKHGRKNERKYSSLEDSNYAYYPNSVNKMKCTRIVNNPLPQDYQMRSSKHEYHRILAENAYFRSVLKSLGGAVDRFAQEQLSRDFICIKHIDPQLTRHTTNPEYVELVAENLELQKEKTRLWRRLCMQLQNIAQAAQYTAIDSSISKGNYCCHANSKFFGMPTSWGFMGLHESIYEAQLRYVRIQNISKRLPNEYEFSTGEFLENSSPVQYCIVMGLNLLGTLLYTVAVSKSALPLTHVIKFSVMGIIQAYRLNETLTTENMQLAYIKNSSDIISFLDCSICTVFMKPPIFQCREGHTFCKRCTGFFKKCPFCRDECTNIRCRGLEKIAEYFSSKCAYHTVGCQKVMPVSLIHKHEEICAFQPTKCPHYNCNFSGTMDQILIHLQKTHSYSVTPSNTFTVKCSGKEFEQWKNSSDCVWQKQIYCYKDKYYILRVRRLFSKQAIYYISLFAIHPKHHNSRYRIHVFDKLRKFSFEGPVWSILKGVEELERVKDCLIIYENIALFLSGFRGSEADYKLLNLSLQGEICE